MILKRNRIQVYEHQSVSLNQDFEGVIFDEKKLEAFENYYGTKGVPFFTLIKKGIQFNEYVGVIQVGNTVIEVLPKADKFDNSDFNWQNILIGM